MPDVMHFYVDDSGTRHPDRKPSSAPAHEHDWFGLGGILIKQEDEEMARAQHEAFCQRWAITAPLHSSEIRGRRGPFAWIGKVEQETRDCFMSELSELMIDMPIIGHACVIDRPGYNHRYLPLYGRKRWLLCKTAFSVAVERAAKCARQERYKLKIFVERCDNKTDKRMEQYYEELCNIGMPFDANTSGKYGPLSAFELADTLYEFRTKHKTSPIMQIADLYLWPICMGGYDPTNRTYAFLKERNKLIDCQLPEADVPALGIKYSCWGLVGQARA